MTPLCSRVHLAPGQKPALGVRALSGRAGSNWGRGSTEGSTKSVETKIVPQKPCFQQRRGKDPVVQIAVVKGQGHDPFLLKSAGRAISMYSRKKTERYPKRLSATELGIEELPGDREKIPGPASVGHAHGVKHDGTGSRS